MNGTAATFLAQRVREHFADAVIAWQQYRTQETVVVKRESIVAIARFLKEDAQLKMDILMDLSCVDYKKFGQTALSSAPSLATPSPLPYYMQAKQSAELWERGVDHDTYRFDMVYHFFSTTYNHRLRVRVPLSESDPTVDSLTPLWDTANWFEREVWDMFGVHFNQHPDLRRLLMYEEFQGHPLRKDYPIRKRQPLIGPKETV